MGYYLFTFTLRPWPLEGRAWILSISVWDMGVGTGEGGLYSFHVPYITTEARYLIFSPEPFFNYKDLINSNKKRYTPLWIPALCQLYFYIINHSITCILSNVHMCLLSRFSRVWLFVTPWTIAFQAPLSLEFSSQEYWGGLSCPPPGDLPDSRIKPSSPALQVILYHWATGETLHCQTDTAKSSLLCLKVNSTYLHLHNYIYLFLN